MKVTVTQDRIVVDRQVIEQLLAREGKWRALVLDLRRRQLAERDLLTQALHELASKTGAKDRVYFARRWLRDHREQEERLWH
jgi:hypothetical protein